MEDDTGHIVHTQGPAIDEYEHDIRKFGSSLCQCVALHKAGANDDLGAVLNGSLHGVIAVIIGSLSAVSRLIILVGLFVLGSKQLHAVVSTLVKGLILQLANVGHESDLILAVFAGHLISDAVGIGSICLAATAGDQRKRHHQSQEQG